MIVLRSSVAIMFFEVSRNRARSSRSGSISFDQPFALSHLEAIKEGGFPAPPGSRERFILRLVPRHELGRAAPGTMRVTPYQSVRSAGSQIGFERMNLVEQ